MSKFDNGILHYIKAEATVTVFFPVDKKGNAEIACKHCNHFIRSLQRCGLTQTIVNFPEHYVGIDCPLTQVEVIENV